MNEIWQALAEADPLQSWWPFGVSIGVGIVMAIKTSFSGQTCPARNDLENMTIVLNGADDEVCLEVATELCTRKVRCLVLASKNIEQITPFVQEMRKSHPNVHIQVHLLDSSSFKSVQSFAKWIGQQTSTVDILINHMNRSTEHSGAMTSDCLNWELQTNFLSPLLLTILLLPMLRNSKQRGRIINVVDDCYAKTNIPISGSVIEEISEKESLARAHLATVLATNWLARKWKESSQPVTVNTCITGPIRKKATEQSPVSWHNKLSNCISFPRDWLLMKTPKQGAQVIIYLAAEPSLADVSGQIFNDCEKQAVADVANDAALTEELMAETLAILKLDADALNKV